MWKKAIAQTTGLVKRWAEDGNRIKAVRNWTNRLALHNITSVFFDLELEWKDYAGGEEPAVEGYQISFASALFTVLNKLALIFVVPRFLLRNLPFKACRETCIAITDWKSICNIYAKRPRTTSTK